MTDKRILKSYIRLDSKGRKIAGSNVLRQKMPKVGRWVELETYQCCNFSTTTTTINPT